ncbi:chemotaxis protein CheD [Lachnospiraceae bacterium KM106-2]|nr:chemotaxis protein CheD [Lachnospiraceae bacterium KM106-2]
MSKVIRVGMADMNLCTVPDMITTLGLGSCVGIVLYDPVVKVSGMVHIMLPDSTKIRSNENIAKFADTGIEALLKGVLGLGAKRERIIAKIAGGAQMFAFQSNNDMLRVGERNVEAAKEQLTKLKIPLKAQDTGANYGRTIEFYPETGDLLIKSVGKSIKTI